MTLVRKALTHERTESVNFWVALFSVIYGIIAFQGVNVPTGTDQIVVDAINSKDIIIMLEILVPNLVIPIVKVVKKSIQTGWDWGFIRDTNVLFQIGSVLLLVLEMFNILPQGAGVASVVGGQTINIGIHMNRDNKPVKAAA